MTAVFICSFVFILYLSFDIYPKLKNCLKPAEDTAYARARTITTVILLIQFDIEPGKPMICKTDREYCNIRRSYFRGVKENSSKCKQKASKQTFVSLCK